MLRRIIVKALMIILCFAAETSLFRMLNLSGAAPNLILILTVSAGVMRGDAAGLLTGFFGGLLCDAFSGSAIGLFAFLYMLIGFFCGRFHKSFYPENMIQPLTIIAVSDFAYCAVCYIVFFFLRSDTSFFFYLMHIILPELIYTVIVALIVYPLILRINTWLEDIESRSERKFV